jgi:hypothetical protein
MTGDMLVLCGIISMPLRQPQHQWHKVISQIRRPVICINTPCAPVKLSASRRSGELWAGVEHEEIVPASSAPSRRSGELWKGFNHEEITSGSSAPSRRSGELWAGIEHEEVSPTADV